MTCGERCKSNRRMRTILYPMIDEIEPGEIIKSNEVSAKLSNQKGTNYRDFTPSMIGALLREHPGLEHLGHGLWKRVPA